MPSRAAPTEESIDYLEQRVVGAVTVAALVSVIAFGTTMYEAIGR